MHIHISNTTYVPKGTYNLKAVGAYSSGLIALRIFNKEDNPITTVTVNLWDKTLAVDTTGLVCVKDWSENEGILKDLIDNKVIHPKTLPIPTGYCTAHLCRLTDDAFKKLMDG